MVDPNTVAAVIPARGGSKSIPRKNLAILGGQPLIMHVISAALRCQEIERVICTTDDTEIADLCLGNGIEVAWRPPDLATDEAKISDVLYDLVSEFLAKDVSRGPGIIVLMQPTSPFVAQQDLRRCIALLRAEPDLNSVQTVSRVPHNQHAFNQRTVSKDKVEFCFPEERKKGYNKQAKPILFQFGNIVAVRTKILAEGGDVFAQPSGAIEIERHYSFDLDGPEDLAWGDYCLSHGLVVC